LEEQSPPTRYRGRRRVPEPPRSRYAAVVTTAMVGAGVVALGASTAMDDAKLDPNRVSSMGGVDANALEIRAEAAERASRAVRDGGGLASSISQAAPDVWLLPLHNYSYSSPYGWRWGRMHEGIDLAAPHGAPIYAANAGTVVLARWYAGYGYAVIIDHGNGTETLYAHSSQLLVSEGQEVSAGDRIALVGNTGYSFGAHLHFEVHVNGVPVEPVAWLNERGVDILQQTEAIYDN
jgi:murein DD-endopeptidase MepM/ murein hydrolase activator NlpD